MTEPTGRRARTGYTHVDPDKVVHIDRPSNFSLRVVAVVAFVLATLAGATDMMFGAMRGWRTADGRWEVTPQGSGDYI